MRIYDEDEAKRLQPDEWMVECLKYNPSYVCWGPYEDYMWKTGDGWDSRLVRERWADDTIDLDDLNEVVNFYFEIDRPREDCPTCGGKGIHPDAQWVTESWYSHTSPFKRQTTDERQAQAIMDSFGGHRPRGALSTMYPTEAVLARYSPDFRSFCERMRRRGHWDDEITEDEAAELVARGRGKHEGYTTAEDWNNATMTHKWLGHDSINAWICQRRRCVRFGIPHECPDCEGHGDRFTGPARLGLVLWLLHPRKGASRGVHVKQVERSDLPSVFTYLREAAQRNADRFSLVPKV